MSGERFIFAGNIKPDDWVRLEGSRHFVPRQVADVIREGKFMRILFTDGTRSRALATAKWILVAR